MVLSVMSLFVDRGVMLLLVMPLFESAVWPDIHLKSSVSYEVVPSWIRMTEGG